MRTPKQSCRVVFLTVTKLRKKLYKLPTKEARNALISRVCTENNINENHIRRVLGGW